METYDPQNLSEISEEPEASEVPQLPSAPESQPVSQAFNDFKIAVNGILKTGEMLKKAFSSQAFEMMASISRTLQEGIKSVLPSIVEYASKLVEAFANLKLPIISDEEAEQMVESNRMWGQFGWTHIPSMPINMFNTPPEDILAANKVAIKYCSTKEMDSLFDDMRKWNLNKKDLESAIFCYQNKQYKACALLLCGLIDSKLIRMRTEDNRPVGEKAVKKLKAEYDDSGEKCLAEALFVYNLLAYLEVLFSKAYGFKNEPDTLNRNYIDHGMNRRAVRKRDCIQLFLALHNLMHFLDLGL